MSLEVPEAWDLGRVRTVVQAIADKSGTTSLSGLSPRHVGYHLQAGRVLGLLRKENQEHIVTALGQQLLATSRGSKEERLVLRDALLNSDLIRLVLPRLSEGMTIVEVANALHTHAETHLAEATARKRAGYLLKWLEQAAESTQNADTLVEGGLLSQPQVVSEEKRQDSHLSPAFPESSAKLSSNVPLVEPVRAEGQHSSKAVSRSSAEEVRGDGDAARLVGSEQGAPPQSREGGSSQVVQHRHSQRPFRSEIRQSQILNLLQKIRKRNYGQYLLSLNLSTVRGFAGQLITFDFPVTALIGPNGGGKTTILGAAACAYKSIPPRQFFAKSGRFDDSMQDWSIDYEIVDKKTNIRPFRQTASFRKSKWYRDALAREVMVFGVARTVPATERADLRKCASNSFKVPDDRIEKLTPVVIEAAQLILAKDIKGFTHMKVDSRGKVTLLAGLTSSGVKYSEFHFGAGESSVIRMAMRLETAQEGALVLIEEIENGLHPVATVRMVEYLIDVADRKKLQVIFTTHSEDALLPLPPQAIWAAVDRRAFQGHLSIHSLRAISPQLGVKLVLFTEDVFAKD